MSINSKTNSLTPDQEPPTNDGRLDTPSTLLRGARLIDPEAGIDKVCNLLISPDGVLLDPSSVPPGVHEIDAKGLWALPGLVDLQVHFRQPGFEYKETIESGSQAALAGGITSVVVMPNTHPSLDTPDQVRYEIEEARRVDGIDLMVAAAVTQGLQGEHLTDHSALKDAGAVAVTDDGLPVMDDAVMEHSLRQCAELDLLFMQHAEDLTISQHAPMTLGPTSRKLGVRGQSADAEGVLVERDIRLAEKVGARYHVLHTSTRRSLDAIRQARARGAKVSCEASPHHLLLTDEACGDGDSNFKMNPPLRCEDDRQALVDAVVDGTVDAVATDHAPHASDEKARGFVDAPFGVVGLATALAAVLRLMHDGLISDRRAVELLTSGPARVLHRSGDLGTLVGPGAPANLCLVDPEREWVVTQDSLRGRSKNSAFLGQTFRGRVVATFLRGRLRYTLLDGPTFP